MNLYREGLTLAEIESLETEKNGDLAAFEPKSGIQPDLFEETFNELKKWDDVKSSKHGTLLVIRERHSRKLGTPLKVANDLIQENEDPPKKKLYNLKLFLLEEIGWSH